jgi:serine/threonine protein kinase
VGVASERPLVLKVGSNLRRFKLDPSGAIIVGRGHDAQVVVMGPLVSRHHCQIRLAEKGLELRDLGSLNGTFVNGKRVEAVLLAKGDLVRVGDTEIVLESPPSNEPPCATCDACGRLISMETLEDGLAFELGERVECAACRAAAKLPTPETERRIAAELGAEGFELLARLSPRGAFCPVFKARRRDLQDVVALKVLPIVPELPEKKLERFRTEARVMAQLKHPNVVAVYDVRHRAAASFIVMEFVPGETLHQRLEFKVKLRLEEALGVAVALASALEAAGNLGIVHRNVKPSNVILARGTGDPRLIDFGLAKMLRPERGPGLTDTAATLGTIRYMAPEQMRDPTAADLRSDIYSLGATIFHAVTGKLPHHDKNELDLLQAAQEGQKLPLDLAREEDIPQALKNVLACALMRDPADRHPNATVLLDELRRVQALLPRDRSPDPRKESRSTIRMPRRENGTFFEDELLEIVRALGANKRSGTLDVKSGVRGGSLVFHDGNVIAARTLGGLRGEEACFEILALYKGEWIFKPGSGLTGEADLGLGASLLVKEMMRRRTGDETQSD